MSTMYADHVDPDEAFTRIAMNEHEDLFAWDNPAWTQAGVVTPSDSGSLGTRNSFPARRAAIRILREAMGLGTEDEE